MNIILTQVQHFLSSALEGKAEIPQELAEEFGQKCAQAIKDHFSKEKNNKGFTIRMSKIGGPLCQQQLEQAGAEREKEPYHYAMKMLLGHIVELSAITIMKAAGVNIEAEQEKVQLDIGGRTIQGTLDVQIDGKPYDIKSASPYSFTNKFTSWDKLVEDDPFGYVEQGYLYAESKKAEFGGFIAINKSTGEWAVCTPPAGDDKFRAKALQTAAMNIDALVTGKPFKRQFDLIDETWRKKATGNKVLGVTCSFCTYKKTCFKGMQLTHSANPRSEAQFPKKYWYIGEVK